MKRFATALCALAFTAAISGAALADCPAHASTTTQTSTPVKGS
ncbi:hypothetical protein [Ancylobacter radicis]|nr:hypothetical protein [Ancylobacter radicis]